MYVAPTFQIEGLNKLLRALEQLDAGASESFKNAGKRVGELAAARAQKEVPVRTGRLQSTIRPVATRRGGKLRVGTARAPYAGPIHFGWPSRNIRPNEFLYRAVDGVVIKAVDMYLDEVYKIWNRNV